MISDKLIAHFEVEDVIHEGLHTAVYLAKDTKSDMQVVLKTINKAHPTPREIAQISAEYKELKELDLDGVIKVLDLVEHRNLPVIVEEFIGKETLADFIQETERIEVPEFLNIASSIADALRQIHSEGLMHKDINPYNILYNPSTNRLKLIDFGIAAKRKSELSDADNPNVLEGTLRYSSPEQTGRMNRSIDYRTDFYSLGVTFYEMLTGVPPFTDEDPLDLVHSHLVKPVDLANASEEFPTILCDIIVRLTSKNAEDRYQSAAGLKHDIDTCIELLNKNGHLDAFELGQMDYSSTFSIPQQLFGRKEAVNKLLSTFEQLDSQHAQLLLVTGHSGIGKSALIREIHKPSVKKKRLCDHREI